jgi:hypothetical protein
LRLPGDRPAAERSYRFKAAFVRAPESAPQIARQAIDPLLSNGPAWGDNTH